MLRLIDGPNFSGRTTTLRNAIRASRDGLDKPAAYVGPEVFTSFSGLASTLAGELDLVGLHPERLIRPLQIENLLTRELSTLSGGEEVLCAIAAGLACEPAKLALDCVLEQLDQMRRKQVCIFLMQCVGTQLLIADNRAREWANGVAAPEPVPSHNGKPTRFARIDGDATLPDQSEDDAADIDIVGLRHRYRGGPWVLEDVQIRLNRGRIIHLAGENGAGKTTLAKILVGAIIPTAGTIHHGAMAIPWKNPGRLAAYHFQNPDTQLFRSTVRAELLVGARRRGRASNRVEALVGSAACAFGLREVLDTHPLELPFSMRKRVAMAATVACGTPWLIIDEPTLGQDDQTVQEIANYLRRLSAAGRGIIVISHSQPFVESLPHQRVVLMRGKVAVEPTNAH